MDDSEFAVGDAVATGTSSMGRIDASVIVCSYNRAESLHETLSALRVIEIPSGVSWEVVVVDNNSNDNTREMVKKCRGPGPQ